MGNNFGLCYLIVYNDRIVTPASLPVRSFCVAVTAKNKRKQYACRVGFVTRPFSPLWAKTPAYLSGAQRDG